MYEPNRISTRRMEAYIPDRPDKCVPSPGAPADSAAPVQYGIVEGWIFRQDGGRPLAGANLVLVVGQIWLVTATVNAYLGGNVEIVFPAAVASTISLLLNLGLLRFLVRLEK